MIWAPYSSLGQMEGSFYIWLEVSTIYGELQEVDQPTFLAPPDTGSLFQRKASSYTLASERNMNQNLCRDQPWQPSSEGAGFLWVL